MDGRTGTAKLYNNCQYLESSNCKEVWRTYWNLTSATKFNVGQYNAFSEYQSLHGHAFPQIMKP